MITCPTCGCPCTVRGDIEGTCYYEPDYSDIGAKVDELYNKLEQLRTLLACRPGETVLEVAKRWRAFLDEMLADEWPETVDNYDKGTTIKWCWHCQSSQKRGHRGFCVMLKVRELLGKEPGKVRDGIQRARELIGEEK